MPNYTTSLNLLKKDPNTDGNDYFNIQTMLNDNWDKIDAGVATKETPAGAQAKVNSLAGAGRTTETVKGNADSIAALGQAVTTHEAEIASLQNEVKNSVADGQVSLSNTSPVTSFNADVATPVDLSFTAPDMVVNLFGNDGDCESLGKWTGVIDTTTEDTTLKVFGSKSFKIVKNSSNQYLLRDMAAITSGKYYMYSAYVYITTALTGIWRFYLEDVGTYNNEVVIDSSTLANIAATTGKWIRICFKFQSTKNGARITMFGGSSTGVGTLNVDGMMLNEITADEYNNLTVDQLLAKYPYINGIKPLVNPMVKVSGKNLVKNGNYENGVNSWILDTNAVLTVSNGKFSFASKSTVWANAYQEIRVKPNTDYYLSFNLIGSSSGVNVYDETGSSVLRANAGVFNTGSRTKVRIYIVSNNTTATLIDHIQLEEGIAASVYESHKESSILLNGEFCKVGSYADTVKLENGVAKKLARFKKVILDGSLAWVFGADLTGCKMLSVLKSTDFLSSSTYIIEKYDGKSLKSNASGANPDDSQVGDYVNITVADTQSGWGESYTPTAAEIKAYFNGWIMYGSDFGVYTSGSKYWSKLYTGTGVLSTQNIHGYSIVSGTETGICPTVLNDQGYTPYKLWYAVVNPVEEKLDTVGSLGCFAGQNTISVETGIVYEKPYPILYGGNFVINNTSIIESWLKYKTNNIVSIYKNGIVDNTNWAIGKDSPYYRGGGFAYITPTNYDTTAEYYTLYQMLPEEYNSQQISLIASYPNNLREAHNKLAETVTNIQEDLSEVWIELLPLADKEMKMAAIANLTTETTTDLKNKINEILNVW